MGWMETGRNAVAAIEAAEIVFGGKRHLELAAAAIRGEARPWPVPFDAEMSDVVALRGRRVCVLASGDPFFMAPASHFCGGYRRRRQSAIPHLPPSPSAAARLGWALQSTECVSLHGRSIDL